MAILMNILSIAILAQITIIFGLIVFVSILLMFE